jgi:predicted phage baseplate assembly protein
MTVWWERGRRPDQLPAIEQGEPRLVPGGRAALIAVVRARIAGFTPDWRPAKEGDAGDALIKLFGTQLEPVLARIERLDERALIEFLSTAGLSLPGARPASALVAFEVAPAAPAPVVVPPGFQLASAAADGSPDDVIWETQRTLAAIPGEVAELFVHDGETIRPVEPAAPFEPFGPEQRAGSYLLIGLDAPLAPSPTLSLGVLLADAATAPTPVAEGGEPGATASRPVLRWEALAAGGFQPVEVITDGSALLARTGIVELRLPRGFPPDRPAAAGEGEPRRWLRLRLLQGRRESPTPIARLLLNVVSALAARSIRDELPTPLGASAPRQWRLSQTPVLEGSLVLVVDEGIEAFDDAEEDVAAAGFCRWHAVETLSGQPPDARVYVLDPATGIISFGDNRTGRAPPAGIRNIVARLYQVAAGRASAVEAESITRMLRSIPHLRGVTNPLPASGGVDTGTLEAILASGPALVRARGRAVSPDDMALLAGQAPGADVARAFALRGVDPALPGARMPGVVGLFVVPRRRPGDPAAGPPVADQATLGAAAAALARDLAPLGARVVAGNPRYHRVRIEAAVEIDAVADAGAVMRVLFDALDRYLDPYRGGEAGDGWGLGAPLRHARLVRRLHDASAAVRSVPYLAINLDGHRHEACADAPLSLYGLPWPDGHELIPQIAEIQP